MNKAQRETTSGTQGTLPQEGGNYLFNDLGKINSVCPTGHRVKRRRRIVLKMKVPLQLVVVAILFVLNVDAFPNRKRSLIEKLFEKLESEKRSPINYKHYPWNGGEEEEYPIRHPHTTYGEKRSPINYKHQWNGGEDEYPYPHPKTTYGEKRSPINYKNYNWNGGEEEYPYPHPKTTYGEKRSPINYKNYNWNGGEEEEYPFRHPHTTYGEKRDAKNIEEQ